MGQYLTIGIATSFVTSKKETERVFKSVADYKTAFENEFNRNGIYQMTETDSIIMFELKPESVEHEWVDFIRDFYHLRYGDEGEYREVLETLSTCNTLQKWLDIAENNRFECYQADGYLQYPIERPVFPRNLYVDVQQVILSIDGKIVMECYNDLFAFFTKILREKLSRYRMADSLLVYITG